MNSEPFVFLFAPGAGAPSSHPWMRHWTRLLETAGAVHLLDYPYMLEGRKRPDPLPKLVATHRTALGSVRSMHAGRIILIGKSMGSRIGCHVALEETVAALVCLGYPLCGGGGRLRDAVLRKLSAPILFVQGTRDPLCPLDLLEKTRLEIAVPNDLHIVDGGDHSLRVSKTHLKNSRQSQEDVDRRILGAIHRFIEEHTSAKTI